MLFLRQYAKYQGHPNETFERFRGEALSLHVVFQGFYCFKNDQILYAVFDFLFSSFDIGKYCDSD